ncbi:MAG: hypothetical protein H0U27_12230 [Nitrosopumilus sp.]|nr:hypothetical protein [Nitrosopumilus sp.]
MKKFLLILLYVLGINLLHAQSKLDVGLIAIPSITNVHANHDFAPYNPLFALNYGIKAQLYREKFAFSSGLLHFTQGAQFQVEKSTVNIPEGTGEFFDIYIRVKTLVIPLSVDYLFKISEKTQLFAGLGFYTGYIYSQQMENTSIPENYHPDPFFTPAYPVNRFSDIDHFNHFYLGINPGIGVKYLISPKLNFQIRPNLLYQIRKKQPEEKYPWTNRLISYSVDVGFSFRFGTDLK